MYPALSQDLSCRFSSIDSSLAQGEAMAAPAKARTASWEKLTMMTVVETRDRVCGRGICEWLRRIGKEPEYVNADADGLRPANNGSMSGDATAEQKKKKERRSQEASGLVVTRAQRTGAMLGMNGSPVRAARGILLGLPPSAGVLSGLLGFFARFA